MTTKVILSAVGSDRPGLTQSLAEAIQSAGGNWLESHLSRLGGKYVGSVLVELPEERLHSLQQAIDAVDAAGLRVSIVAAGNEPEPQAEALSIAVVGQDRPGIVREVTTVLAGLGVNIEDLVTGTENSAHSGERLFRATARVRSPEGTSFDEVRTALEAISGEIMVDLTVAPPER